MTGSVTDSQAMSISYRYQNSRMSPGGRSGPGRAPSVKKGHPKMKHHSVSEPPPPAPAPTLQNVVDLVGGNPELSETRRRDLPASH
jgi:hypothetical protein